MMKKLGALVVISGMALLGACSPKADTAGGKSSAVVTVDKMNAKDAATFSEGYFSEWMSEKNKTNAEMMLKAIMEEDDEASSIDQVNDPVEHYEKLLEKKPQLESTFENLDPNKDRYSYDGMKKGEKATLHIFSAYIASGFSTQGYTEPKVDSGKVKVDGDKASVPMSALEYKDKEGKPVKETNNESFTLPLVVKDGKILVDGKALLDSLVPESIGG